MLILIRGAGDLASGIALRLHHAGMRIVMTELPKPTVIRRTVSFSQAVLNGKMVLEDITASLAYDSEEVMQILNRNEIAVIVDPEGKTIEQLHPDAVVDAIIAKRNTGTKITDAPIVVGVGPGFTAGVDCHAAIESMRGHTLGRVIYEGSPLPNTNIPGFIGGFAGERILRAPADGIFHQMHEIGDMVQQGDVAGTVNGEPMICQITGMLRGILAEGTPVTKGLKSGDVDPRGKQEYCYLCSDKAIAIGGGVLEAVLHFSNQLAMR